MPVKFNMKNCVMENVGRLSNKPMTAYLECGSCGEQHEIAANAGQAACPKCGSTHVAHLSMGAGKPEWFKRPAA